jgi:hypothetical protein
MKYTIISGNPVQGFSLWGIFDSMEDAIHYGENYDFPNDWTVIEINRSGDQ